MQSPGAAVGIDKTTSYGVDKMVYHSSSDARTAMPNALDNDVAHDPRLANALTGA